MTDDRRGDDARRGADDSDRAGNGLPIGSDGTGTPDTRRVGDARETTPAGLSAVTRRRLMQGLAISGAGAGLSLPVGRVRARRTSRRATASPIATLGIDEGLGVRGSDIFYFRSGDRIKRYDRSTDSVTDLFAVPSRARDGSGNALAFGDGSLWFADATQDNYDGRIVELDPATGTQRSEINLGVDITGLAYGGGSLWAADITSNGIIEFTPDGERVGGFDVGGPADTVGPQGLAYAGGSTGDSIFLGENDNNSVHEFAPDGTHRGRVLSGRSYESLAATSAELLGTNADGDLIQLLDLDGSDDEGGSGEDSAWTQQAKLVADDGDDDDDFGFSVAVAGDTAVVGAYFDEDPNGPGAGSAYVFERSGSDWTQQAKLLPDDGDPEDFFGVSVAVAGDTAVVGAPSDEDPNGPGAGSAYVFEQSGSDWTQQAKLLPNDGGSEDNFGVSVAVTGDTAVVGGPLDDNPNGDDAGSAYVFRRSGSDWTQQAKLLPADGDPEDRFGSSVAVAGDTAVVGADNDEDLNGDETGSAYVFKRSGSDWTQQAKLPPDDGDPEDRFGFSVAVTGDTAVVGAFGGDNPNGDDAGSAYVFRRSGGDWTQRAKLLPDDGGSEDNFGLSVAVNGNTAVVGALNDEDPNGEGAGSAYVFTGGAPDDSESVRGQVLDEDGDPVANASVRIPLTDGEITTQTDSQGEFVLDLSGRTTPDPVTVFVEKDGFVVASINVGVGESTEVEVQPTSESIVQLSSDIHHLGDGDYNRQINSQFQESVEGDSWETTFDLTARQADATGASLITTIRGAENDNPIFLNGTRVGVFGTSDPSGNASELSVDVPPESLTQGSNRIRVESINTDVPSDIDDFEISNIRLRLTLPNDSFTEVAIEATRTKTVVRSPVTVQVTDPDSQEYEYRWTVADRPSDGKARLLHEDQLDTVASSKSFEVFLPLSDGRWELSVTVEDESGTQAGTGSITVDVNHDRLEEYVGFEPNGFENATDLIEEYAPKYEFAAGEQYFPTRYEAYTENARVIDSDGTEIHDEPSLLELTQRNYDATDEDNELFLKGDESDFRAYQQQYPRAVHANVTDTVFNGDTYLAVEYLTFYLFDPKKQTGIDGPLSEFLLSHASDTEKVVVLFDEEGPEWVGASQHYDGTYARWEKVDKEGNSVVVYPAQGAHANYLVDTGEYEFPIPYQARFVPFLPGGTGTPFPAVQVDAGIGDTTGGGRLWTYPQDYELITLTGNEPWGEFGGVFTSGPGAPWTDIVESPPDSADPEKGRLPQQDSMFDDPGQYVERGMTSETVVLDDGLVQGVLDVLSSLFTENLPELPAIVPRTTIDDLTGVPSEFVIENFRNPGKKPHEFAVEAELDPNGSVTTLTYEDTKRLNWRPRGPVSFNEIRVPIGEEFEIPDEGSLQLSVDVRTYPTDLGGPMEADWQQDDSVYRVSRTIDLDGLFNLSLSQSTFSTSDSVRTTAVQPGDEVDSTVTLTNSGDSTERVTVTLAARGPGDALYNRNWEISEEIILPPGDPIEVTLSYPITSELSEGTYDLETDVWLETGSETLTTELRHTTDTDAFEITKPQGTVTIETVPKDASVYIAGNSGTAPLTTTLPEGTYSVDVVAGGADPLTKTVSVVGTESRTTTIDVTSSTLQFSVDSTPEGATVFIDGERAGETPLTTRVDADAQYDVRLEKDGYKTRAYDSVSPRSPLTVTLSPVESILADEFDDDGDDTIQFREVVDVIKAYNSNNSSVEFSDVVSVIRAYNGDGQWDSVNTGS